MPVGHRSASSVSSSRAGRTCSPTPPACCAAATPSSSASAATRSAPRAIMAHALEPALAAAGLPEGAVSLVDRRRTPPAGRCSPIAGWRSPSRAAPGRRRQLGALARQAGIPVSLHGTGGAWLVAGDAGRRRPLRRRGAALARPQGLQHAQRLLHPGRPPELVPLFLDAVDAAGAGRATRGRLHVVAGESDACPPSSSRRPVTVEPGRRRAEEPLANELDADDLGGEWEWEETPEVVARRAPTSTRPRPLQPLQPAVHRRLSATTPPSTTASTTASTPPSSATASPAGSTASTPSTARSSASRTGSTAGCSPAAACCQATVHTVRPLPDVVDAESTAEDGSLALIATVVTRTPPAPPRPASARSRQVEQAEGTPSTHNRSSTTTEPTAPPHHHEPRSARRHDSSDGEPSTRNKAPRRSDDEDRGRPEGEVEGDRRRPVPGPGHRRSRRSVLRRAVRGTTPRHRGPRRPRSRDQARGHRVARPDRARRRRRSTIHGPSPWTEQAADFDVSAGRGVVITPPTFVPTGTTVAIAVAYWVDPGPSWRGSALRSGGSPPRGSFVLNEPDGARPGCRATITRRTRRRGDSTVTVPAGLTAVANGGSSSSGGRRRHVVWEQAEPMATYLVQLLTGDYELIEGRPPALPMSTSPCAPTSSGCSRTST